MVGEEGFVIREEHGRKTMYFVYEGGQFVGLDIKPMKTFAEASIFLRLFKDIIDSRDGVATDRERFLTLSKACAETLRALEVCK